MGWLASEIEEKMKDFKTRHLQYAFPGKISDLVINDQNIKRVRTSACDSFYVSCRCVVDVVVDHPSV